MALNDDALFTAAKGFIYVGAVGTAPPTPAEVSAFDPGVFATEVQQISITGTPTGGTFTLTYDTQTTTGIAYNATAAAVKSALEALSNIDVGDVVVEGGPLPGAAVTVRFTGKLAKDVSQMTSTDSLTGGATPVTAVTTTTAPNGWASLGHTSREDLPEPGFEGGDTETKGSWQTSALKEVVTESTVDYIKFNLHQFDENALELYYSQPNGAGAVPGEFKVMDAASSSVEKAFLMVIVDGDAKIAMYGRKTSVRREDAVTFAIDEFSVLPMRATFLKDGTNELMRWISEDMGINPA